jgi:hypothetical protein
MPLLGSELRKGTLELPHALVQDDLLFGIWCGIYPFAQDRMWLGFIVANPPSFGPVEVHGKIVRHTK